MSVNFGLGREIYSTIAWAVDAHTFPAYLRMLQDFRNGVILSMPEEKYNSTFVYNVQNGVKTVSEGWQARNDAESDLIYIINLNGVITKNGGDSTWGTKDLANKIKFFESFPNVKGGIIIPDSGGGSANAVEIFNSTVLERTKPIVVLLEKGSMAASACYGCISGADYIMSDGKQNIVGSIGTMAEFQAIAHGNKDADGVKMIRVYATKSTAKNKWYEEAVNNDNYEPLISEVLDPSNEAFLSLIKANRPQILETQLDGSDYRTGKVKGSLIDGFGTMQDAVNKVLSLSKNYSPPSAKEKVKTEEISVEEKPEKIELSNNNLNPTSKMDKAKLKAEHPELFSQIVAEGVQAGISAEKDRTGAWLAHANTDIKAVVEGIEGGGAITATAREKFLVKASTIKKKEDVKIDSAGAVEVEEAPGLKTEQTEAQAFYANVLKEVK